LGEQHSTQPHIPGSNTAREPAPGELAHVQSFVNTHDLEDHVELLETPDQLRDWLAERGWLGKDERLGEADLRQALTVREAIRSLLLANNGAPLDERAVESLNDAAARAQVLVRFDRAGRGELAAARQGIDGALGQLLAIVYRSMAEGDWHRLKACPLESCTWAFYDRSKNRSSTWCDMTVCGNRAKARKYRARQAAKAS
jgi:predicted RNA-binding Zn ribbon-like protein